MQYFFDKLDINIQNYLEFGLSPEAIAKLLNKNISIIEDSIKKVNEFGPISDVDRNILLLDIISDKPFYRQVLEYLELGLSPKTIAILLDKTESNIMRVYKTLKSNGFILPEPLKNDLLEIADSITPEEFSKITNHSLGASIQILQLIKDKDFLKTLASDKKTHDTREKEQQELFDNIINLLNQDKSFYGIATITNLKPSKLTQVLNRMIKKSLITSEIVQKARDKDIQILKQVLLRYGNNAMDIVVISKETGYPLSFIRPIIKDLNLSTVPSPEVIKETIISYLKNGLEPQEIADKMGVTIRYIDIRIRQAINENLLPPKIVSRLQDQKFARSMTRSEIRAKQISSSNTGYSHTQGTTFQSIPKHRPIESYFKPVSERLANGMKPKQIAQELIISTTYVLTIISELRKRQSPSCEQKNQPTKPISEDKPADTEYTLTKADKEILDYLSQGLSDTQIAMKIGGLHLQSWVNQVIRNLQAHGIETPNRKALPKPYLIPRDDKTSNDDDSR